MILEFMTRDSLHVNSICICNFIYFDKYLEIIVAPM